MDQRENTPATSASEPTATSVLASISTMRMVGSPKPVKSGWALNGISCADAQYYYRPSQLQHLQLLTRMVDPGGLQTNPRFHVDGL